MQIREVDFRHVVIEGTPYQAGHQLGNILQTSPAEIERLARLPEWMKDDHLQAVDDALELFERYCPGLTEEIKGLADAVGIGMHEMVFYAISHVGGGHCGQFAVTPDQSVDGHLYVGRSYEWGDTDDHDRQLMTTRIHGKAAHLGFSLFHFGRLDGLNEHGLCVTMTGQPFVREVGSGVQFWVLVRSILDNCRSVEDALEVANRTPTCYGFSLMICDCNGSAAIVESAGPHRAIRRKEEGFIPASTNHFLTPDLQQYQSRRMWQSVARYQSIERLLKPIASSVSKAAIKDTLTRLVPDGLCGHYYSESLGTLWSTIIDVTAGTADICFGSPQINAWRTFDLAGSPGVTEYRAKLPLDTSKPGFWTEVLE